MAAFLVLVGGVAQIGLAVGQAGLAARPLRSRTELVECVLWSGGCLTVICGTLVSSPVAVAIGSGPLVATLAISSQAVRRPVGHPLLTLAYRILVVILLASIPLGVALAWMRR